MAFGCMGVWVAVSWCRSQVGSLVLWFPSEADLSLNNLARFAAVCCPVAQFPLVLWSPKYLELDLVKERIDGGLAILAILILDLQNKGTDWEISPVLQGY